VRGLCRRAAIAACASSPRGSAIEARDDRELVIVLTDNATLRDLNRRFRGKDRATNVLSFPAFDGGAGPAGIPVALGDVLLAFETIVAEAAAQEKTLADHLVHLVVHGTLHLLGHDHTRHADAKVMEALEVTILARLGVADPYAAPLELAV
jgi:probable rRNA maturation factor